MSKKNKMRKPLHNYLIFLFIILFFSKSVSQNLNDDSIYSYVIMKMDKGVSNKVYGLTSSSFTMPDEIYINGNKQDTIKAVYSFSLSGENNKAILIWKNPILNCKEMFRDCGHIIEIDFSHFNTSQVTDMSGMFRECKMLRSLNLSNFDTSNVSGNNICNMFCDCHALKNLDISNFDTSKITGFGHMFYNCKLLASLDLSSFNYNKIQYLDYMFYGCEKLSSLNLGNFYTPSLINFSYMFYNCILLEYLDLSNFKTSLVNDMNSAFYNCKSLTSLDLSNFDTTSITQDDKLKDIFTNCDKLEFINLKNYKNGRHDMKISHFQTCSNNIVICTLNYKLNQEINDVQYISNNIAQNYYKYNEKLFDNNKCTEDCKSTSFKYEFKNQCYNKCPEGTIKRENDNNLNDKYFCKPICNKESPFEMLYEQKCVKDCDIKIILDKLCIKNYYEEEVKEKEAENKIYDAILENLETNLANGDLDTSDIEKGKNEVVEFKDMTITLTATKNQKDDKNNANMTTVDLGECEDVLRKEYKIPENEMIFMKKIDVFQEGMKIPKIAYDVYRKSNDSNLIKLDLSFCSKLKADISIPVLITESLDKLNSSSGYYNDLCYTATSDSGTDINLNDRKDEYVKKNKNVCQEKCIFSDYDYNINKAKCSCDIEESSSSFKDIKIDKDKLYDNFINVKNIANINLLVCYKVLFSKKGIKKNYGCFSLIPIILIHFILVFLFWAKDQNKKVVEKIKDIKYAINNWKLVIEERKIKRLQRRQQKLNGRNKNIIQQKEKNISPSPITIQLKETNKNNFDNPPIKNKNRIHKKLKNKSNNNVINKKEIIPTDNNDSNRKISSPNNNNEEVIEKAEKIMVHNDNEINDYPYKKAKKYDRRTYCMYYISLLRTNHDIIFTFFYNSDYNSKIIKIDLL